MSYIIIAAAAVGAGIVQTVTGFGSSIFLMLFLPFFFDMLAAPAVASAITLTLSASLTWQFRKKIQWRLCILPTLVYLSGSMWAIGMVKSMDMEFLTLAFGLFLIVLSVYFLLFSSRLTLRANWPTATVCAAISGVTSGLFGIGGPLMAIYFVTATQEKEAYSAASSSSLPPPVCLIFLPGWSTGSTPLTCSPLPHWVLRGSWPEKRSACPS